VVAIDDGGLDFGTVALWVCPDSCAAGNGGWEVVVVQPPPDIATVASTGRAGQRRVE